MLLPRKLIILAIIIHVVTIIACASLQPKEDEVDQATPTTEQTVDDLNQEDEQQKETAPAVLMK